MNWTFVLFGNLIMDSSIALFAIFSGLEARYRRIAEKGRISKKSTEGKIDSNKRELEKILAEDKSSLTEISIEEKTDQIKESIITEYIKDTYIKKAEKYSPATGIKPWVISIAFIIGGVLQAIGIIFD
jgi:hypothetical protein